MPVNDTRRKNLQWLIDHEFKGRKIDLAKAIGVNPCHITRGIQVGLGDRLAKRVTEVTGKPDGWLDEVHLFSLPDDRLPNDDNPRAVVVSPFGQRCVPVLEDLAQAVEWITSKKPYRLTELTETDWLDAKRCGNRTLGIIAESEEMMPEIHPGDAVFFDPELEPQPGDFVLVQIRGKARPLIRRYRQVRAKTGNAIVTELSPLHPDFLEVIIKTPSDGKILGVMVMQRKYRRRASQGK